MTQNLMQESTFEDELDLRDLIKILIESKKALDLTQSPHQSVLYIIISFINLLN